MSVLDKFLNVMKMNDDDGFDEEYLDDDYDEDYEEFEEERPKKRILTRFTGENYEDSPAEEEAAPQQNAPLTEQRNVASSRPKARPAKSAKVSPMRTRKGNGMEVCVIRPKSMEDAREITETLLEECTVVLNMEGLDLDVAQRIIDFSSGSCYAIHGNLQKISNYIFIITPQSVDISGDFQEILSGAFEVPSFGTRF